MNKERVIKTINNINSVLFLVLLIVLVILLLVLLVDSTPFRRRNTGNTIEVINQDEGSAEKVEYKLGYLKNIYGSDTYFLELKTVDTTSKLSYGGESSTIRNILILKGSEIDTSWLFPANSQIIKSYSQWRLDDENDSDLGDTYKISLSVTKYDTNEDGKISLDDNVTKMILDPNDFSMIELGTYDRIIKTEIDEYNNQYIILASKSGDFIFQRFNMNGFSLVDEKILHEISIEGLVSEN